MKTAAATLVVLTFAGLAFFGYVAMSPGVSIDGALVEFSDDTTEFVDDDGELDAAIALTDEDPVRVVSGQVTSAPRSVARPMLAIEGRVVREGGAPIAGAEVRLYVRRSFSALRAFGQNRERTSRIRNALMERARAGNGRDGRLDARRMQREMFQLKKVASAVKTGPDGKYSFRGPAYDRTTLEVAVVHGVFAPSTLRLEWKPNEEKAVFRIEDIVVEAGGVAFGVVVDEAGAPVQGASVRYAMGRTRERGNRGGVNSPQKDSSQTADSQNRRRGGGEAQLRGRNARTNRGGRNDSRTLEGLIPVVTTNANGQFEMPKLPTGPFAVVVEKSKYLPGRSEQKEILEGARVDCGKISLTHGVEVSGVVTDQDGEPIAGVEVTGSASRTAFAATLRKAREEERLRNPQPAVNTETGRRDRRGARGGNGNGSTNPTQRPGAVAGERRNRANQARGRGGRNAAAPDRERRGAFGSLNAGGLNGGGRSGFDIGALRTQFAYEQTTKTDAKGAYVLDALPKQGVRLKYRHAQYVDEDRDPIDPRTTPRVDVSMFERLAVGGVVVEESSGRPIENYGIVARRVREQTEDRAARIAAARIAAARRGQTNERSRRVGRGGSNAAVDAERAQQQAQRDAQRQQRVAQRDAERKAQQSEQDAYKKQRFGASGESARRKPKPEPHKDGRFLVEGLQPGTYLFDIYAPGYAHTAAGPITLARDARPGDVKFHLALGAILKGRVLDKLTGKPVRGASVALLLPPLKTSNSTRGANQSGRNGRGGRGGIERERGGRNTRGVGGAASLGRDRTERGTRVAQQRTDEDGRFAFDEQRAGVYRVVITARRYLELDDSHVVVRAGAADRTFSIAQGGTLFGTVTGRSADDRIEVVLTTAEGARQTTRISGKGEYEFRDLAPGGYAVRVEERSRGGGTRTGRGGRGGRNAGARFGGRGGVDVAALLNTAPPAPDVWIREGEKKQYDLDANRSALGVVRGTIYRNGQRADGITVSLQPKTQMAQQPVDENAARRDRGRNRLAAALLSDRTDEKGAFEIKSVPAGMYVLEVRPSSGRGRRGGGSALHSEEIVLAEGATWERQYQFDVAELAFQILNVDTGEPITRAIVGLALSTEAANLEPSKWRSLASVRYARTREGKVEIKDLTRGAYKYAISGRGITEVVGTVTVGRKSSEPITVKVKQIAQPPQEAATGAEAAGTRRENRGARGAAPGNTGGRAGARGARRGNAGGRGGAQGGNRGGGPGGNRGGGGR